MRSGGTMTTCGCEKPCLQNMAAINKRLLKQKISKNGMSGFLAIPSRQGFLHPHVPMNHTPTHDCKITLMRTVD